MKVLWIASMLPTRFNWLGGPWNVRSLKALRDQAGLEVRAICPVGLTPPLSLLRRFPPSPRVYRDWFASRWTTAGDVEVDGLQITYLHWAWPPKMIYWSREGRLLFRRLRRDFGRYLERYQPDVIHAPWLHPEGAAACLLGEEFGIPVVAQGIGNDVNHFLTRCKGRALTINDLQKASALLFNCQSIRRAAQSAGLDHPNVAVIYHGVDVEKFKPDPYRTQSTTKRIITVAQLIPRKNHQLLLNAFAMLPAETQRSVELEFVGGGPSRLALERQAHNLNIADRVRFVGQPPHDEMIRRLQQADLFCLPTLSEGMPVATIEAMACGLPVVASNVDGIPEAVEEGTAGLLVPRGDATALAAALQTALDRRWSREAVRDVVLRKFTWERYAREVSALYNSVSDRRRPDGSKTLDAEN